MYFKKRIAAVTAVVAMAAAVFYGSTREMSVPGEQGGESLSAWFEKKETIYFWYSDEAMTNYINSAAVAFGEKEDVRVIPVHISNSEYLEALNEASLSGKQVPDAYIVSHESLEKAYLAGLATQIEDVSGVCDQEHFPEAALCAVTYEGRQVAYPLSFETSALVYNETYLALWAEQSARRELSGANEEEGIEGDPDAVIEEGLLAQKKQEYMDKAIPGTVDDIRDIANTFDLPEGVEGVMKWDVSDIFYNYWIVGNYMIVGGDAGDDAARVNINNPETIQCLEVYKALNQFFFIESDTVSYESVIQDFMEGKTVFTIATTDVVGRLAQARAEGTLGFEYGICLMPEVSAELASRSMSVTKAVAINGYSTNKELANRFAAFLVNDCADTLYERTGKVSANRNAEADNGALQIFKQEYAGSIPLPKLMETGNFWLRLEKLFFSVWNGADTATLVQELADQIGRQLGN